MKKLLKEVNEALNKIDLNQSENLLSAVEELTKQISELNHTLMIFKEEKFFLPIKGASYDHRD